MTDIQRWDAEFHYGMGELVKSDSGELVDYDDRLAALSALQQEIKDLRERLTHYQSVIDEVNSWAVCYAITDLRDIFQNLPRIVEITSIQQPDEGQARGEYDNGGNHDQHSIKFRRR